MMRTLITPCVAAAWALCLTGCVKYTQPVTQPAALTAPEKDFDVVWQAARQTLRTYRFDLDRQDRRAGVITTLPMTGMHFFELWRKDAARPVDFSESTVQTLYRTARVSVRPVKPGAKTYAAQVEVLVRRSDKARAEVTSASEAYSLFSLAGKAKKRRDLLLTRDGPSARTNDLVDLGHDRALEARLTAAIAKAAGKARGK